jgi:hypothetical protein
MAASTFVMRATIFFALERASVISTKEAISGNSLRSSPSSLATMMVAAASASSNIYFFNLQWLAELDGQHRKLCHRHNTFDARQDRGDLAQDGLGILLPDRESLGSLPLLVLEQGLSCPLLEGSLILLMSSSARWRKEHLTKTLKRQCR